MGLLLLLVKGSEGGGGGGGGEAEGVSAHLVPTGEKIGAIFDGESGKKTADGYGSGPRSRKARFHCQR